MDKLKLIRISAIWCSSCIITYSSWKEIKQMYPEFEFNDIDYDDNEQLVKKYEIGKIIPVIIILNNEDVEIGRIIGEKDKKEIIKIIEELKEKI